MLDPLGRMMVRRNGEIDARIVEHPLGVIGFGHARARAEQGRIELDRLVEISHPDMDVEAFHAVSFSRVAEAGAQPIPPQQFSMR